MKKQSLALVVCIAVSTLSGCSDALSKEDIAKLSMKEAAVEACKAYASMDADRIIAFLEEKYAEKTKNTLEKGLKYKAREQLEQSVCIVTDIEEKRRYTMFKFENFVKNLKMYKGEDGIYKVKSLF
jgi:RNA polymerase-interacting CarD/CdnL/TRCF family regulator